MGQSTALGNVHKPWEDPEPLGSSTSLGKIQNLWQVAQTLARCTNLGNIHKPGEFPQPLERCATLGRVITIRKVAHPLGRRTTLGKVHNQPFRRFTTIWEEHNHWESGHPMGNLCPSTLSLPQRGDPCAFLPNHHAMSPCSARDLQAPGPSLYLMVGLGCWDPPPPSKG